MMRLIDIDAELRKTAEFLETLVIHQRGVIPCIVLVFTSLDTVDSRKQRAGAAEKSLRGRRFLALFLYDDFLCIRYNDVKI